MSNSTEARLQRRALLFTIDGDAPLSTSEVADITGVSIDTLRTWNSTQPESALLPYGKRGGRNWYRASDVRSWLTANGTDEA